MPCGIELSVSTLGPVFNRLLWHFAHAHLRFYYGPESKHQNSDSVCQNQEIGNGDPWNASTNLQKGSNEPLMCFEWHSCAKRGRKLSSRQSHWSANATQNTSPGVCWQHSHLTVHDYVSPDRLVHLIEIRSVLLISVAAVVKGKFT